MRLVSLALQSVDIIDNVANWGRGPVTLSVCETRVRQFARELSWRTERRNSGVTTLSEGRLLMSSDGLVAQGQFVKLPEITRVRVLSSSLVVVLPIGHSYNKNSYQKRR